MATFSYAESDPEFERWTHNLLRSFIKLNELKKVELDEKPNLLFVTSTALRVNKDIFNWNIPLVLIHNEAWTNYWPPCGPEKFEAILGCCLLPFDYDRFIQYPYYAVHFDENIQTLLQKRKSLLTKQKTKFCCFVTSNDRTGHVDGVLRRIELFDRLNAIKHVDAAGKVRNNVGYLAPTQNFIEWISDYKFMICMENTKINPGYITEKPFTPWFAGTVPVYDGACVDNLNGNAIVKVDDIEKAIQHILELDQNNDLYEKAQKEELMDNTEEAFSLSKFELEFRKIIIDKFNSL